MTLSRLFLPGIFLCGVASAQLLHPVAPMPSFAVASVRPASPNEELSGGGVSPDSYRAERTTLKDVLAYAFGLGYEHELDHAPSWVANDRFDIQGKLDDEQVASLRKLSRDDREEQMRLMVQSMLAERFHLAYHFETRELPVYLLEVAESGLKCPRDTTSPAAIPDLSRPRFRWSAAPAPPPPPPGWHPPSPSEQKVHMQALHLRTKGWPFWLVVALLSHQPELEGRPVIDTTGLEGNYDCEMNWSQADSDGAGESFFSAVRDQLGLKFQPSKGPVEVLVIDSISRPTEN
jgi:bla regulator protein BlaR1